jgi:hypothetical protein
MKIFYALLFSLVTLPALSQSQFSMYRMNNNLPQGNMLNPALYPNYKVVIGLPVVSSMYFSFDNDNISFRDLFRTSETDSLALDTVSIFQKLKAAHRMKFHEELQLFYLGIRGKKSFYSFSIHQVGDFRFNYPGDLIGWAIRGPGHPAYSGKPLDFGNFYGRGMVYNKIALSYAREITPWLRIGARYNYILGVAAGQTSELTGSLSMGIDSVHISTGNVHVQTAGVDFFDQDNLSGKDYQNYLLNSKNRGMSIDLGAAYDVTDNITITAALNDLGYIQWKDYTRSYQVAPITYTFRGFDMLDYLNQDGGEQFMQAELDSLENLYDFTETAGGSFKTPLVGKFYAGINIKLLKVNHFSALVYFDMFQKKIDPAISLGYNLQVGRTLNATVGVTYQNGMISNVGAGIALKLTHLQFYAASDRANSFVYPARASKADIHMGMNLVFGKARVHNPPNKPNDKTKEPEPEPVKEEEVKEAEPVQETEPAPVQQDTTKQEPLAPVIEDAAPPIIEKQDVVADSVPSREAVTEPKVEEVKTETHPPAIVEETKPEPVKVEPAEVVEPEPRYEIVKKGSSRDELSPAHYVIVGAFKQKENASRYSKLLQDAGYENGFGFASEKNVYYVHVLRSADLNEAREKRDNFRKIKDFQFQASWVLTVQE